MIKNRTIPIVSGLFRVKTPNKNLNRSLNNFSFMAINNKLQIWVLTRNRVNFLKETIESLINQKTIYPYQIVISDNSTDSDTESFVQLEYPELTYIRRNPTLESKEHFKKVFIESDCDFLVMFHDDDVLKENYIQEMYGLLIQNKKLAAVGCNSDLIANKTYLLKDTFLNHKGQELIFSSGRQLATFYFDYSKTESSVPFPGYMYRKSFVKLEDFEIKYGGKYADVLLLMSVANRAPILFTRKVLMSYRMHSGNDSAQHSICDRLSLLRYFIADKVFGKTSLVYRNARFNFWRIWYFSQDITDSKFKRLVVRKYLFISLIRLIFFNPKFVYIYFRKYIFSRKLKALLCK
jgi:hypothetical protein